MRKIRLLVAFALLCQPAWAETPHDARYKQVETIYERMMPRVHARERLNAKVGPALEAKMHDIIQELKKDHPACSFDGIGEIILTNSRKQIDSIADEYYEQVIEKLAKGLDDQQIVQLSQYLTMNEADRKLFEASPEGIKLKQKIAEAAQPGDPEEIKQKGFNVAVHMMEDLKTELPHYVNSDGSCAAKTVNKALDAHYLQVENAVEAYMPKETFRPIVHRMTNPDKNLGARGMMVKLEGKTKCPLDDLEAKVHAYELKESEAFLDRLFDRIVTDYAQHLSEAEVPIFHRYVTMTKEQKIAYVKTPEGAAISKKVGEIHNRSLTYVDPEAEVMRQRVLTYANLQLAEYINADGSCRKGN